MQLINFHRSVVKLGYSKNSYCRVDFIYRYTWRTSKDGISPQTKVAQARPCAARMFQRFRKYDADAQRDGAALPAKYDADTT